MSGSTIDTLITLGVTLGTPGYGSPLTLTTAGTIAPPPSAAISATGTIALYAPATLPAPVLANDGMITGGQGGTGATIGGTGGIGIELLGAATVTNQGTITGGSGGAGVGGSFATPGQGGTGGIAGVFGSGSTITNDGLIAGGAGATGYAGGGGGWGLYVTGNASVTNDGLILGGAGAAGSGHSSHFALVSSGGGGNAVVIAGAAAIDNNGTIIGGEGGVDTGAGGVGILLRSAATVVNAGTIIGGAGGPYGDAQGSAGIAFDASGLLVNFGYIKGGNDGKNVRPNGSNYIAPGVRMAGGTIINEGVIKYGFPYGVGSSHAYVIDLSNGTLINGGTIIGQINLSGNSTLIAEAGAVFNDFGLIKADPTAGGVLLLAGSAASELNGLIGGDIKYFTTFDFAAGANWTLYATPSGLDSGQTISGFAGNDQIILDGSFATSPTYVAGVGLELTSGATTITLDITGSFSSGDFTVTDSQNAATIALASATHAIDSLITFGVTLGTGAYLSPLTITNTGTIAPIAATSVGSTGTAALYGAASLSSYRIINDGTVIGGAGGPGGPGPVSGAEIYGGTGGAGIMLLNASKITNAGFITGGAGGNYPAAGSIGDPSSGGRAGNGGTGAVLAAGTSLTNTGHIGGGAGGSGLEGGQGGIGISATGSGYIFNAYTASIIGGAGGYGGDPLLPDGPVIAGGGGVGILLTGNATVKNEGTITGGVGGPGNGVGADGIVFEAGGLLENDGTIRGGNDGANSNGSGSNLLAAGVVMTGGTLINAGYIYSGQPTRPPNGGAAIDLTRSTMINRGNVYGQVYLNGHSTFVASLGSHVYGVVTANLAGASALILAPSYGTFGADGSQYLSFSSFDFDGRWTAYAAATDNFAGESINGFTNGDAIILNGSFATSPTYVAGTGLELTTGASTITLDITGNFATDAFTITNSGGHATLALTASAPCFAAGTRILTPRGDIAVENLAIGDLVITKDGEDVPITWIGQRHLKNLAAHPSPELVQPVLIAASAFQNGIPSRDLVLSPDHALYLSACLIPARSLINGANILQLNRAAVTYYHIELAHHDIIFAENTPVETYLDTGNRFAFENTGPVTTLHPNFMQHLRCSKSCAPFIDTGPIPASHRTRTQKRAPVPRHQRLTG